MNQIEDLITNEENKLKNDLAPNEAINILYNLISLKNRIHKTKDNYKDIKSFINYYIDVIKFSDYGYDVINYEKIEKLINLLEYKEQISVLQYAISVTKRELPEHNKEWFVEKKHKCEIDHIWSQKTINLFPKAFFLYSGLNISRLLLTLLLFFLLTCLILLPSPKFFFPFFNITYDNYSESFIINHFLNIFSLFADIDNDFKIKPINWFGLISLVLGKISFIILIVNFFYRKITDKISFE
jgi:hypothetical protein